MPPPSDGHTSYAATHEALCRSWIFDLLTNLADAMEAPTDRPSAKEQP